MAKIIDRHNRKQLKEKRRKRAQIGTVCGKKVRWKLEMYYLIYDLALKGLSNFKISKELGVNYQTLQRWVHSPKSIKITTPDGDVIKNLLEKARKPVKRDESTKTFLDFIYKRLPDDLKDLWEELNECDMVDEDGKMNKNGEKRRKDLLEMAGKRARQHLFLYAFCTADYNIGEACRIVNISRNTFDSWCRREEGFRRLMGEINEAKKDFFESKLVQAAKAGDVKAIIFGNKTLNKDRGYSEKLTVEHQGTILHNHNHTMINLDELYLPVDVRKRILEAVKNKEERERLASQDQPKRIEHDKEEVIDAEYTIQHDNTKLPEDDEENVYDFEDEGDLEFEMQSKEEESNEK